MIEMIAIGDELLQGYTLNSNASFISYALMQKGYITNKQIVISDDEQAICNELKKSITRASLVIVCGGLGPTLDDGTKQSICKLLDQSLIFNEKIYANLKKRFPKLSSLKEQAMIPEGAYPIENEIGTAPGLIFKLNSSFLILLPGVPSEMKPMFEKKILPYLEKNIPSQKQVVQQEIGIFLVAEETVDQTLRKLQAAYPLIKIGIYPGLGYVRIRFTYQGEQEKKAKQIMGQCKIELEKEFKGNTFTKSLEVELYERLTKNRQSLILAESCTGGALAAKIIAESGASSYVLGSIVCYSDLMKEQLLKVKKTTLDQYGAVSKEVVHEMLEGLLNMSPADFAVAISGIAGPGGGTKEKPVGTVYIGIAKRQEPFDIRRVDMKGDRARVIEQAVYTCLALILQKSMQR